MNRKHIFFTRFCPFCRDVNTGSLPAILTYLRETHSLSYSMTSGLMFANSGFSSVLQPIFGLVADRRPRLWYMPAGLVSILGLTFGGIFAPVLGKAADLWGLEITFHLLALFVLVGLVMSFFLKERQTA